MWKLALLLVLFPSICQADVSNGLIHWWKFDDASGSATMVDSGNTRVDMTVRGTPVTINGKNQNGLFFNGSNQDLQSSVTIDLSGTNVISLAFWFLQPSTDLTDKVLFELGANANSLNGSFFVDPTSNAGTVGCTSGHFEFVATIGTGNTTTGYNVWDMPRPSMDIWHHYIIVLYKSNANASLLYLDGVSQSLSNCTGNALTGVFANATLNVMSRNNTSLFKSGLLDDVRMWNRALTASEAIQLYNQSFYGNKVNNARINNAVIN